MMGRLSKSLLVRLSVQSNDLQIFVLDPIRILLAYTSIETTERFQIDIVAGTSILDHSSGFLVMLPRMPH